MAIKINSNKNYTFVWITDGQGWNNSKNKLEEAYNHIPNFHNLDNFIKLINE